MGANSRGWSATMRERLGLDMADLEIERVIVDDVVDRYRREGPPLIPGAIETVHRDRGRRSGRGRVVGPPRGDRRRPRRDGAGRRLRVVVSSDSVAHGKPAPDVYLEAARQLGCDPGDCLVIEDSRNGVLAARTPG